MDIQILLKMTVIGMMKILQAVVNGMVQISTQTPCVARAVEDLFMIRKSVMIAMDLLEIAMVIVVSGTLPSQTLVGFMIQKLS